MTSRRLQRNCRGSRRGVSAPEVLVVLAIVTVVGLLVVMGLTRQRETARFAGCQRNLMQIGIALAMYDQSAGQLPFVPDLADSAAASSPSPLGALLIELHLPDLSELSDRNRPPPRRSNANPTERPIAGFLCGSDPNKTASLFPAPVSYRATTGDLPDGRNGAFAPGRRMSLADVEARDGTAYTAAFAERLVGDGRTGSPAPMNYALVPGPVSPAGCPEVVRSAWRGDAGASWWKPPSWQSSLYNHALTPNASPSCIAGDGRTALMGASSGHVRGVNVLLLDGAVRTFTPRVDPKIWREWANVGDPSDPRQTPARAGGASQPLDSDPSRR
jgi:hypothetical protein